MRTVREIYEKYQVPPWLQLHQVRVAAVGKMVCDALQEDINTDLVVRACLVHDIGAIVKFDFTYQTHETLQNLCQPEDIPHWIEVQVRMREKYGMKEYTATEAIIRELGLERVRLIFEQMGISHMARVLETGDREAQVAQYGDMRVGPYGVVLIQERVADVTKRYAEHWKRKGEGEHSRGYPREADELEKAIFRNARIHPDDINDASAAPVIEKLWDYVVA